MHSIQLNSIFPVHMNWEEGLVCSQIKFFVIIWIWWKIQNVQVDSNFKINFVILMFIIRMDLSFHMIKRLYFYSPISFREQKFSHPFTPIWNLTACKSESRVIHMRQSLRNKKNHHSLNIATKNINFIKVQQNQNDAVEITQTANWKWPYGFTLFKFHST